MIPRVIDLVIIGVVYTVGKTGKERMRGEGEICWEGVTEVEGMEGLKVLCSFWGIFWQDRGFRRGGGAGEGLEGQGHEKTLTWFWNCKRGRQNGSDVNLRNCHVYKCGWDVYHWSGGESS